MNKLEQLHLFLKFHHAPDSEQKRLVWECTSSMDYCDENVRDICKAILIGDYIFTEYEVSMLSIVASPSKLVAGQTDAQWAERMTACNSSDKEAAHADADRLLANLVLELGYPLTAQAWQSIDKWYA